MLMRLYSLRFVFVVGVWMCSLAQAQSFNENVGAPITFEATVSDVIDGRIDLRWGFWGLNPNVVNPIPNNFNTIINTVFEVRIDGILSTAGTCQGLPAFERVGLTNVFEPTDGNCILTHLAGDRRYEIQIFVRLGNGDFGHAHVINVTLPPGLSASVPSAPTISEIFIDRPGRIEVSWEPLPPDMQGGLPIIEYVVNAIPQNVPSPQTLSCRTTGASPTSCTIDTRVIGGIDYAIIVQAFNREGASVDNRRIVRTPRTIPPAPQNVMINVADEALIVSWDPVQTLPTQSPIIGYDVRVAQQTSLAVVIVDRCSTTSETTCTVSNLRNGETYFVAVVAINELGPSEISAVQTAIPLLPPGRPAAPEEFTGASDGDFGTIELSWVKPDGNGKEINDYVVTLDDTEITTGPCSTNMLTGDSISCTLSGLRPISEDQQYTISIKAISIAGTGGRATTTSTASVKPELTKFTATVVSGGIVELSWVVDPETDDFLAGFNVNILPDEGSGCDNASLGVDVTATRCTINGLTVGRRYDIQISTLTAGGLGYLVGSAAVTSLNVPGAPTGFGATRGDELGEIDLNWTAPADNGGAIITSYRLAITERGGDTITEDVTSAGNCSGGTCAYTLTGLTDGATYEVTVAAVNSLGPGTASASASVRTLTTPGAPTRLGATTGDALGEIDLSWTAPSDNGGATITSYMVTITEQLSGDMTTVVVPSTGNCIGGECTYTLTGLTDRTTYDVQVEAVNSAGPGAESAIATAATLSSPGAVASLTAIPGIEQIRITWRPPRDNGGADISGYRVAIDNRADLGGCAGPLDDTARGCTVAGLDDAVTYTLTVVAINALGDGLEAEVIESPAAQPGAPSDFRAVASSSVVGQIDLSWGPPAVEDDRLIREGYQVLIDGVVPTAGSCSGTLGADVEECSITGLTGGDRHEITLTATYTEGGSGQATGSERVVLPEGAPTAVPTVTLVPGDRMITVSWTEVARAESYIIRVAPADASGSPITVSATITLQVVRGLTNGRQYTIRVRGSNTFDDGKLSAPVRETPLAAPGAPTDLGAATGDALGEIDLSWTAPSDNGGAPITSYSLTITERGGDTTTEDVTASDVCINVACAYTLTSLTDGATYDVTVAAVNSEGSGTASASETASTLSRPGQLTGLRATASVTVAGRIDIAWTAPAAVAGLTLSGYRVTVDGAEVVGGSESCAIANLDATSVSCMLLGRDRKAGAAVYTIVVGAVYTSAGGVDLGVLTSAETTINTFAAPDAPTGLGATTGDAFGEIDLNWTAPSDNGGATITSYTLTITQRGGGTTTEVVPSVVDACNGAACSYALTGLNDNATHDVTVAAVNSLGPGAASSSATADTLPRPAQLTGLRATASVTEAGRIDLRWNAGSAVPRLTLSGYRVTVDGVEVVGGLESCATANLGAATSGVVSCMLTEIARKAGGGVYTIRVEALYDNASGDDLGALSAVQITANALAAPGVPTALSATRGDDFGEIGLSWTAPSDNGGATITSYRLAITERGGDTTADNVTTADGCTGTACSYTLTGLNAGTTYDVTVTAANSLGPGEASLSASASTLSGPPQLTGLDATASMTEAGRIDLRWNAGSTVARLRLRGYRVAVDAVEVVGGSERCASINLGAATSGVVSCRLTDIVRKADGGVYTIRVEALYDNASGDDLGALSAAETTVNALAAPGAPPTFTTDIIGNFAVNGRIALTWTEPDNMGSAITGYEVTLQQINQLEPLVIVTEETPTGCTTLGPDARTCTLTGLTSGQLYELSLRAVNAIGQGDAATQLVRSRSVPAAVTNLRANIGIGQIRLTWNPSADANFYRVTVNGADLPNCAEGSLSGSSEECTVTGLDNAVTYTFQMVGVNPVGDGEAAEVSASPAAQPGVPSGFSAVSSTSVSGQIDVSWGPPADEDPGLSRTGYRVLIDGAAPTVGTCAVTLVAGATECIISGAAGDQSYEVTLVAIYAEDGESTTATRTVNVPIGVPPTAPAVTLFPGDEMISVRWTEVAETVEYIINITPPAPEGSTITVRAPTTERLITGLTNGQEYTIQVRGNNNDGDRPLSDEERATPRSVPGAPTFTADNTGSLPGNGRIVLTWTEPDNMGSAITGYEVTLAPEETPTGCTTLGPDARTCTLTGLPTGLTYEVSLRAVNAIGQGDAASQFEQSRTVPVAVTNLRANIGIGLIRFSWNPSEDASFYRVTVNGADLDVDGCAEGALSGSSEECTVTGLDNAVTYTFQMVGVNPVGDGEAAEVRASPAAQPGVPAGFSAVVRAGVTGQIDMSWGPPADEDPGLSRTGYRVLIDGAAPTVGICSGTLGGNDTECNIAGLTDGESYDISLVATYAEDGESITATATVVLPAGRPTSTPTVTLVPGDELITASWTEVAETVEYIISVDPADASGSPITVAAPATSVVVGGLTNDTEYTIKVRGSNIFGDGPESDPVLATPRMRLGAPTGLGATTGDALGEIDLSWTAPSENGGATITSYRLTITERGGDTTTEDVTASDVCINVACTHTLTGLTDGATYDVTVAAVNSEGPGAASASASASTLSRPGQLTGLRATASVTVAGRIDIAWTAPAAVAGLTLSGYRVTVDGAEVVGGSESCAIANLDATSVSCMLLGRDRKAGAAVYTIVVGAVYTSAGGVDLGVLTSTETTINTFAAPDAPTGLGATTGDEFGEIDLSWTAPSDNGGATITSYTLTIIERGGETTAEDVTAVAGCSGATCTYTLTGLTDGATYDVTVAAVNSAGPGTASVSATASTLSRPGQLADLTATASATVAGRIDIAWTAPSAVSGLTLRGYRVTVDGAEVVGGSESCATANLGATVSCMLLGRDRKAGAAVYAIVVGAIYTSADGVDLGVLTSAETAINTFAAPDAPTIAAVTPGNLQIALSWTPPADNGGSPITEYTITVTPPAASGSPITVSAETTKRVITGLVNGTPYTFAVSATNEVGAGVVSATRTATPRTVPSAPTLTATGGANFGEIDLTWTEPDTGGDPITEYEIAVNGAAVTTGTCANVTGAMRACTVVDINSLEEQTIAIRARNAAGFGAADNAGVRANLQPGAPQNFQVAPAIEQLVLSWVADPAQLFAITGYEVVLTPAVPGSGCDGLDDNSDTGCTLRGLDSDATYTVQVRAVGTVADSVFATRTGQTPIARPSAPALTVVASDTIQGQITLTWEEPADEDGSLTRIGYRILVDGSAPGGGTCANTQRATDTTCTITGLPGGPAAISIFATYAQGVDGVSATETDRVEVSLGAPTIAPTVTLVPGDRTITVSWTEVARAVEYIISIAPLPPEGSPITVTAPTTERVITGLTNGTAYTIQVFAHNSFGDGPVSDPVSATPRTTPGAPTITDTVVAGSLPGDGRITLSWTAPTETGGAPITGYEVAVSTEDGPITPTGCTPLVAADLTCTLTGLENGTEHTIDLAARNDAGAGATATTTATPVSAPGPVQNLDAIIGIEQIRFTWQPPVDNYGDTLVGYRGQSADISPADFAPCAFILATALRECTLTGLDSATDYTVTIVPFGTNPVAGDGESNSVTARPAAQPGAPAGFSAVASTSLSGQIDLSWGPPANEDARLTKQGYRVMIDGAAPTAGTCAATQGPAATDCTITGLDGGEAYEITLAAIYAEGDGDTGTMTVDVLEGAPSQAATVTLDPGDQMITVSWTAVSAADNYIITVAPAGASGSPITVSAPATSVVVGGLTNGTEYTIQVFAHNSFGDGPVSEPMVVTPRTRPGVPTALGAATGDALGEIDLSWTAPSDNGGATIISYRLTITERGGGTTTEAVTAAVDCSGAACTYTLAGLTDGATYDVTVAAVNSAGPGTASASASANTLSRPDQLAGLTATASATVAGRLDIAWTAPSAVSGLTLSGYRVTVDGVEVAGGLESCATANLGAATGGSVSCMLLGRVRKAGGSGYRIVVGAIYTSADGVDLGVLTSAETTINTLAAPDAPTGLGATTGDAFGEIDLSWTAPSDNGGATITSYTLTITERGGDTTTEDVTAAAGCSGATCAYTLTGLTDGATYDVTVAAVNSAGSGAASVSATASTLSRPGQLADLTATASATVAGRIDIAWTAPSAVSGLTLRGYRVTVDGTEVVGGSESCATANLGAATGGRVSCMLLGRDRKAGAAVYRIVVGAIYASADGVDLGVLTSAETAINTFAAPDAPTIAAVTPGNLQIALSWTPPADNGGAPITEYTITVNPPAASGSPITVSAPATTRVITGLVNGTPYTFAVSATNAAGAGDLSATRTATPRTVPSAPTLTATSGGSFGEIDLSWTEPDTGGDPITEYEIAVNGAVVTTGTCANVTGAMRACTVVGIDSLGDQTIAIRAGNAAGLGAAGEVDARANLQPDAPQNFQVAPAIEQFTLSWDADPDQLFAITGYEVVLTPAVSGSGCDSLDDNNSTDCTLRGLDSDVAYTVQVRAVGAIADSAFTTRTGQRPIARPSAPALTVVASDTIQGQITLTWEEPADEDGSLTRIGYRILVDGSAPGGGTCANTQGATDTTCTITGLPGGPADISIFATYAQGVDGVSATETDRVEVSLGAPTIAPTVTLAPGDRTITVSWEELPAASEYIITVAPAASSGSPITVSAPDTSFEVLGLTNGTAYTIQVGGSNSFGDGPQSAPMRATPVAAPGAPTITADVTGSLPGDGRIVLNWTAPADDGGVPITGYEVTVVTEGSEVPATGCATLGPDDTTCTLTGLTNGTAYAISLVARNAAGPSTAATTTATPRSIPGAVTSLTSIVDGIERIELTWGPPTDNGGSPITGYQVTIDNSANLDGCAGTLGPAARGCTVAGLDSAVEYTLEVVAINAVGDGIATEVSETPAARPDAPSGFSADASSTEEGQIDLSWGPPTNEDARLSRTGYRVMIDGAAPTAGSCSGALGRGATACTITGLAAGNYDVTIVATYAEGDGVTVTDDVDVPFGDPEVAPTVTLEAGDQTITASWTEVPAAANYIITVDPAPPGGSPITVSALNTSAVVGGLTNGQSYDIRVRGANSFGAGPQSAVRMASPGRTPRAAPTIADVDVSTIRNIDIDWDTLPTSDNGGSPITNYEAIATPAPGEGAETVMCVVNAPTTSCTLEEGVFAGIVYEVQVRAINSFGPGDYSAAMTVTTETAAPDMPQNILISGSAETLSVAWDFVTDDGGSPITGYIVRVALEDAPGAIVAECETAADINTCALEELDNDENYIVTVFAVSDEGVSVASAAVRASPGTAIIESSSDYLADFAQNLAAQIVNIVGDHIDSASSAGGPGDSFVSLGGKTLSFEQWAADTADRPIGWGEHQTVEEMLKGNPISFGFHGGGGGSKSGSYTLWGYLGIQGYEGKTSDGQTDFSGDLLTRTLGIDYHLDDGTIGVGVSYSDDEGKLGADKTDVELLSVHPYISWELSESTRFVGQFGLGEGNLKVIDTDGNVDLDEDFQLQFVSLGLDNDLNTGWFEDIELGLRTDAQVVQIDADNRELDSDVWRLRAAIEAHSVFDLTGGGTARPSLEFGVRYDGGDTKTGLGLDTVLGLRMDNPASGMSLEGKARYLLAHRESSKREWSVGMVLSYDIGTKERGLAFSLEPSYGGGASQSRSIWLDKFTVSDQERRMRLRATLGYGMGVLGGAAVMTPYGSYELSDSDTRKLREGLLFAWPAHKTSLDLYLEQSLRDEERNENSVNIKFALDF